MDNENIIHSYKGFDKDLKCRGFAYEIGKDYEQHGRIKCCENGFHACEFPLDVFNYYAPGGNSRYCTVTQSGVTDKKEGDSKVASSKIHIETEIGLDGIIKAGVKFILDKVNWKNQKESNTGYCSAATNTGDYSAATNTGDRSAATAGLCATATAADVHPPIWEYESERRSFLVFIISSLAVEYRKGRLIAEIHEKRD